MISNPIIYKVFKDFTNHRRKTNREITFSCRPYLNCLKVLNTGTTDETFQQSGKQDSFRHILLSLCSMHESSSSQFFESTTGLQSQPNAFSVSRSVLTFNYLGSYRIIMQFQISSGSRNRYRDTWVINIWVLRVDFSKQFFCIKCRREHHQTIEQCRYSRFNFVENTISISPKLQRAKFL